MNINKIPCHKSKIACIVCCMARNMDKAKDRRLVLVPEDVRTKLRVLASAKGITFEEIAGEILAEEAEKRFSAFLASSAKPVAKPRTKRKGK